MVKVVAHEGKFFLQVACEQCGERIADAAEGFYQWQASVEQGQLLTSGVVAFTHKRCRAAFEEARGGCGWMRSDLDLLPVFLAVSLDVSLDEAARTVAAWGATPR